MRSIAHQVGRGILGVGLILVLAAAVSAPLGWRSLRELRQGQASLFQAQEILRETRELARAATALKQAHTHFQRAAKTLRAVGYARAIPWVSYHYKALRAGSEAATRTSAALTSALEVAVALSEPLKAQTPLRIGELSPEQRASLLQQVGQAIPKLQGAKAELELSATLLASLPRAGLIRSWQANLEELESRSRLAATLLEDTIPLLEIAPLLLGYPQEKTYLFVLQNSDEMRPAGGFIGTYGLITFDAGHITKFSTDDVYNLDRFVPAARRPLAPPPIVKYLEQPRFYLRDANWSPDFPTSAKQILKFYHEELKTVCDQKPQLILHDSCFMIHQNIDGVIAIMPEAIRPLLKLVGPITVSGQTFTAGNLTDALEYEVEIAFEQKGIPRPQRKQIISELGHALIAKVLAFPSEKWPEVLHLVRSALEEKQLLLYSTDETLQALLTLQGWAGEIKPVSGDYLAVFDANLFSLKTDPYVPRSIFYTVRKEAAGLTGEVEIVYTYPKAGPVWKTKGYRTWTRVYVPKGAVLQEAAGAMEEEESRKLGRVEVGQEFDKIVFGAFVALQVGETKRLRFKYRLPEYVAQSVENGSYELHVQKQPGTVGHTLTVAVDLGKVPKHWEPRGLAVARDGSRLTWQSSLRRDQRFRIEF